MMELCLVVIGTLEITLLYLVEKTADTEYGTNMAVNFTAHHPMIMLLQALNGLQMVIISPSDLSRCSVYAISPAGRTPSTSPNLARS